VSGAVGPDALSGNAVAEVEKRFAVRVDLDPAEFSGDSLRAGYITSAVEHDTNVLKIIEMSRHKSVDMLRVYSRRVDLFREHSGSAFL
jgi:hypothetical protein